MACGCIKKRPPPVIAQEFIDLPGDTGFSLLEYIGHQEQIEIAGVSGARYIFTRSQPVRFVDHFDVGNRRCKARLLSKRENGGWMFQRVKRDRLEVNQAD